MRIFVVTMRRWNDPEQHSYPIGAFTCLAKAYIEGTEHGRFWRDNKYTPDIDEMVVDSSYLEKVPLTVALDYAILKHPERFDDKKRLIKEEDSETNNSG